MKNIFQSLEWEQFKLKTGYAKSYWVEDVLVLQKKLPLGFSMLYSPMVDESTQYTVHSSQCTVHSTQFTVRSSQFNERIRKIGRENNAIFYRLELNIPKTADCGLRTADYIKSFEEMQPEHTLILDLTKSEDEILAQMKPKGRYNIKVAARNNLTIEKSAAPGKALDDFYRLYSTTGQRHKITFRAMKYFESLLEILGKSGYAELFTIYLNESSKLKVESSKPLASAIILYSGTKAIYLYGASSDEDKNLMAPYQLHFEIIKEAKAQGCAEYDFFGIAPEDAPDHPWAGVTRFKKQFGGEERQIAGSYDLIFKPVMYQLFKIAEKIRRK